MLVPVNSPRSSKRRSSDPRSHACPSTPAASTRCPGTRAAASHRRTGSPRWPAPIRAEPAEPAETLPMAKPAAAPSATLAPGIVVVLLVVVLLVVVLLVFSSWFEAGLEDFPSRGIRRRWGCRSLRTGGRQVIVEWRCPGRWGMGGLRHSTGAVPGLARPRAPQRADGGPPSWDAPPIAEPGSPHRSVPRSRSRRARPSYPRAQRRWTTPSKGTTPAEPSRRARPRSVDTYSSLRPSTSSPPAGH